MTFSDILETLKYSINFEEFQISYNELIPDIVKAKSESSLRNDDLSEWKEFIQEKNNLKLKFYNEYCIEYPIEIIRHLRESKYIYDIDISDEIKKIEEIIKPAYNFKNRLMKLQ